MKALSLTQPWATLVAIGAKKWETRSWSTKFRGAVAIHAAKNYPPECRRLVSGDRLFSDALLHEPRPFPLGQIIAIAEITDCQPTERFEVPIGGIDPAHQWPIRITSQEHAFGNYGPHRFAFKIERVRRITPIDCRGALGFWTVPDDVVARIAYLDEVLA